MEKILIATDKPFAVSAVQNIRKIIEDAGFELQLLENYTQKSELLLAVSSANAVIIRSDIIDKEVIDAGSQLKIVVRAGAGFDNVDLEAATAKGVVVMNTPGQNANAVAELAFGMMLFMARGFYNGKSGTELKDKKMGIHAYGNVGRCIARIAKGFGMKVYAFDPFVDKTIIENDFVKVVDSVEALYESCQYVSLNIPATSQTKKSINFDLLNRMPKNSVLVNTARKEVINEDDLAKVLEVRQDFHYISDIAPDNAAELASKFNGRIFFTPKKMGAQTSEANNNAGIAAAKQIVSFLKHGDKTFQVNK